MNNQMWENIKVGDTIILKLKNDVLVAGEISVFKPSNYVRLKNCRDYQTNQDLATGIYYLNEIAEVRIFDDTVEEAVQTSSINSNGSSDVKQNSVKHNGTLMDSSRILLKDEKLTSIQNMIKSCQYINQYDMKYFDAIKDMNEERQIGIQIEDVQYGRLSKCSLLAVSTSQHIYLFDLSLLKGLSKELKSVLNSNSICKIVHHSRQTHDYLRNVCEVNMNFFFDTMMAYMYVTDTREVISINELLTKLFNLPQVAKEKDFVDWLKRPMDAETMTEAAFKVAFLIEVQQYLIHRKMLRSFYKSSANIMCEMSLQKNMPFRACAYKGNEVVDVQFDKSSLDPMDFEQV